MTFPFSLKFIFHVYVFIYVYLYSCKYISMVRSESVIYCVFEYWCYISLYILEKEKKKVTDRGDTIAPSIKSFIPPILMFVRKNHYRKKNILGKVNFAEKLWQAKFDLYGRMFQKFTINVFTQFEEAVFV